MKTRSETRLECLRMAASLGMSKNIKPGEIIPYAMEFFRWIDEDPRDKTDVTPLAEKYSAASRFQT